MSTEPAPAAGGPVVVVADARTPVERDLLARWARVRHPGAALVANDEAELERHLRDLSATVMPARVIWLPEDRGGERRVRARDLLALTNPRSPRKRVQSKIAEAAPDRVRIAKGDAVRAGDLRARFDREVGLGAEPFARFVARHVTLACDNVEAQFLGERYRVPRLVVEQITTSARFRSEVAALAERLGRPEPAVRKEVVDHLSGFVAGQSQLAIDTLGALTSALHKHAWTVRVDEDELARLRELNREQALVFLPSHRSYADSLVLADVLTGHGFPPNHVIGGGNLSFWPLGPLGRRSGVVFIRRDFGTDGVYKFAMRYYLSFLVEHRFNLEWYIEGGRTRTGKLRPPKLGMLSYVVSGLAHRPDVDVVVVPTSIVYDQLNEVAAMAAEQSGGAKQPENLGFLYRYLRAQRRDLGAARVRFGEPFSLRAALADAGEGSARVEKVAMRVMDGINRATPVTATSLVTFALLGAHGRALTAEQVERVTEPLLGYLDRRALPGPEPASCRGAGLAATLEALRAAGVVRRFDGGVAPVWMIAPGGHMIAAFYRNGALHHLVNRAIVEVVLAGVAAGAGGSGAVLGAWREACRLRNLLKGEFVFADRRRFAEELRAELALLDPAGRWMGGDESGTVAAEVLAAAPVFVAHRTLRPFLDAYLVVAERLVATGSEPVADEAEFAAGCLGVGEQMLLQGTIESPDAVSKDLFTSALRAAARRGLLEGDDVAARRERFLAEIRAALERVSLVGEYEQAAIKGSLRG